MVSNIYNYYIAKPDISLCKKMRFNKQELAALASQTSQNFDREGVMVLKEKQDGFFRRSEG